MPDPVNPQSLNRFSYVNNRPLNLTDPTGHISEQEAQDARDLIKRLLELYGINIEIDFGWNYDDWHPGAWRNFGELEAVEAVLQRYEKSAGSQDAVKATLGGMWIDRKAYGGTGLLNGVVIIDNEAFDQSWAKGPLQKMWGPQVAIAHEFAHYWDWKANGAQVNDLTSKISGEDGPTWYARSKGPVEDWAESVAGYLYPEYFNYLRKENPTEPGDGTTRNGVSEKYFALPGFGPHHREYVVNQFRSLQVSKP